jgi:hypothetical protein
MLILSAGIRMISPASLQVTENHSPVLILDAGHGGEDPGAVSSFSGAKEINSYLELMNKAVELSGEDISDLEAIHILGQGWVADEALAISVYCALKYPGDIGKALIASVNHKGDSDSTGAITGNIVGVSVGLSGIPDKYKKDLELYNIIIEIADDLYNDCQMSEHSDHTDEKWLSKYVKRTYPDL